MSGVFAESTGLPEETRDSHSDPGYVQEIRGLNLVPRSQIASRRRFADVRKKFYLWAIRLSV